jgi:hypothetical protein
MRQLVTAYPDDHLGPNTITLVPLWRSPFGANLYLATSLPFLFAIAGAMLLLTGANVAMLELVRFVSCPSPYYLLRRKASRSALIVSACVVGIPCGKSLYVLRTPFFSSFADKGPASAYGTI